MLVDPLGVFALFRAPVDERVAEVVDDTCGTHGSSSLPDDRRCLHKVFREWVSCGINSLIFVVVVVVVFAVIVISDFATQRCSMAIKSARNLFLQPLALMLNRNACKYLLFVVYFSA